MEIEPSEGVESLSSGAMLSIYDTDCSSDKFIMWSSGQVIRMVPLLLDTFTSSTEGSSVIIILLILIIIYY